MVKGIKGGRMMVENRLTFDEEECKSLKKKLIILKQSKELDKYTDGYKILAEIEEWIYEINKIIGESK